MNKKLLSSLAAGAAALLAACSGDVTSTNYNPVEPGGTLKVRVVDASDSEPASGASVTVTSAGKKAAATGANGIAEIKDVFVGSHILLVEKAGYAKTITSVLIEGEAGGNVYIAYEATEEAKIYPLEASLSGYLFYYDKDGNKQPAEGFKVRFKQNYVADEFPAATVGADGKYAFEGLPANLPGYSLEAIGQEKGGAFYPTATSIGTAPSLRKGANFVTNPVTLDKASAISFQLLGCTGEVAPDEAITCYFSDDIDKEKLTASSIVAYNSSNEEVSTVAVDGKKVTITPYAEWSSSQVRVSYNVYSVNGNFSSGIGYVSVVEESDIDLTNVELAFALTAGQTFSATSTSASVTITAVANASGYYLLYKDDVDNRYGTSFCGLASQPADIAATPTVTATCTFSALGTKTVSIIAVANESTNGTHTKLAGATPLTVKAP